VNPDSLNQVLGQYGGRYQTDIDLAYLRWMGGVGRHHFMAEGGKFPNPWLSSDLVWDTDVTFEGVAASYKLGLAPDAAKPYYWFLTLGAIPVQEIALSSNDKWLYAGQTGIDFQASQGSRFRLGAAYYYFKNVAGQRNAPESNLLDYTAPPYVQKGNTMFDIRNTQDTTQGLNLFALAADFHELDVMAAADFMLSPRYRLSVYADYVKNIGYNENAIFARTGALVPPRTKGYQAEVSFGRPTLERAGAWRTFIGYRYLQRDAVVDAFTDQDYHLGGTDAQGYFVGADVGLTSRVWMRARYLPFNSIDEPQLNINVWQVEVNARF
jgi:hypothetical protein